MLTSAGNVSALFADWTLIVFTVFAQFAAGIGIFASLSNLFNEEEVAYKMWCRTFGLMVAAGVVSMLHLQNPFNAFYTITQVGHSWLSREILSVGIFSGLVFLQLVKPHKIVSYLTSFIGLVLVYVISQVYTSVDAMPFWSNMGTVAAFFGTAFMLGGAFSLWIGKDIKCPCFRNIAISSLVFGALLSLSAKLAWVGVFMQGNLLSVPTDFTPSLCAFALQVLLIIVGLAVTLPERMSKLPTVLAFGTLCFLIAELAGRTVFFVAQLKIGV